MIGGQAVPWRVQHVPICAGQTTSDPPLLNHAWPPIPGLRPGLGGRLPRLGPAFRPVPLGPLRAPMRKGRSVAALELSTPFRASAGPLRVLNSWVGGLFPLRASSLRASLHTPCKSGCNAHALTDRQSPRSGALLTLEEFETPAPPVPGADICDRFVIGFSRRQFDRGSGQLRAAGNVRLFA